MWRNSMLRSDNIDESCLKISWGRHYRHDWMTRLLRVRRRFGCTLDRQLTRRRRMRGLCDSSIPELSGLFQEMLVICTRKHLIKEGDIDDFETSPSSSWWALNSALGR